MKIENDLSKPVTRGGVVTPFQWQLYDCLEAVSSEGLDDIISWKPHGRAFTVHKQEEFSKSIMHRFFKQTRFASFQRQLNLYGFIRIHSGQDKGSYYHLCFVHGQKKLLRQMVRQKIKGSRIQKVAPQDEPNFYLPEWKNHTEASIPLALCKKHSRESNLSSSPSTFAEDAWCVSNCSSKRITNDSKSSRMFLSSIKSSSGGSNMMMMKVASPLFHPTLLHPFFYGDGSSARNTAADVQPVAFGMPRMATENDHYAFPQQRQQASTDQEASCKSLLSQALLQCTDLGGEGARDCTGTDDFSLEELEPIPLREDGDTNSGHPQGRAERVSASTQHLFTLVDPQRNLYHL